MSVIAFHGTLRSNTVSILSGGFKAGTYFAFKVLDAVKFGGTQLFAVEFDDDPLLWHGEADGWQFWAREVIKPERIKASWFSSAAMSTRKRQKLISSIYGKECWICGFPVDLDLPGGKRGNGNNSLSPSLDHVVPVADHGFRQIDNLRITHRACNVRRGNHGVTPDIREWCRRTVVRLT